MDNQANFHPFELEQLLMTKEIEQLSDQELNELVNWLGSIEEVKAYRKMLYMTSEAFRASELDLTPDPAIQNRLRLKLQERVQMESANSTALGFSSGSQSQAANSGGGIFKDFTTALKQLLQPRYAAPWSLAIAMLVAVFWFTSPEGLELPSAQSAKANGSNIHNTNIVETVGTKLEEQAGIFVADTDSSLLKGIKSIQQDSFLMNINPIKGIVRP